MLKGVTPVVTFVIMILVIISIIAVGWYYLSEDLAIGQRVVRIPRNKASCSGTTATIELRNLGNSVINNSNHESMLGLFPDDSGVVARWGFEEWDGNATPDSSGNGNHGTLFGDTVLLLHFDEGPGSKPLDSTAYGNHGNVTGHEPTVRPSGYCKSGRCLEFDGQNDYVDCGTGPSMALDRGFTYMAWVKPSQAQQSYPIAKRMAVDNGLNMFLDNSGSIGLYDGSGTFRDSGLDYDIGEWQHIAFVIDASGTGYTAYRNGAAGNAIVMDIFSDEPSENLIIGARSGGNYPFNGSIDEVAIYGRMLTEPEINEMYEYGRARMVERRQPGRRGYGLEFGGGDYVDVASIADDIATGGFSVGLWFRPSETFDSGAPTTQRLFRLGDSPSNNDIAIHLEASDGTLRFRHHTGAAWSDAVTSQSSWTGGTWYHVLAVLGDGIYVNGVKDGDNTNTVRGATAANLAYLARDWIFSYDFEGTIDRADTISIWESTIIKAHLNVCNQLIPHHIIDTSD